MVPAPGITENSRPMHALQVHPHRPVSSHLMEGQGKSQISVPRPTTNTLIMQPLSRLRDSSCFAMCWGLGMCPQKQRAVSEDFVTCVHTGSCLGDE